jgi:hypothetical protein
MRIEGLLSDVAHIEEQMRLESEQQKLKEKEQYFKADYFEKQQKEAAVGELQEKPENIEKQKK